MGRDAAAGKIWGKYPLLTPHELDLSVGSDCPCRGDNPKSGLFENPCVHVNGPSGQTSAKMGGLVPFLMLNTEVAALRIARLTLAVALTVVAVSCQQSVATAKPAAPVPSPAPSVVPAGYGVVLGGIDPCVGPPTRTPPGYAWGTVVVFQGSVTPAQTGAGVQQPVLPTQQVTSVAVAEGGEYRFALPPGPYVLVAHYEQWQSGWPWASVSVVAGQTTRQDIPTSCL